jgi:hypothetical protein
MTGVVEVTCHEKCFRTVNTGFGNVVKFFQANHGTKDCICCAERSVESKGVRKNLSRIYRRKVREFRDFVTIDEREGTQSR